MSSLPGLRPISTVTLQVGGASLRAGLRCDVDDFPPEAVETFVLLLHRCTRCLFTCAHSSHMTSHLTSVHLSPAHLTSAHLSPTDLSPTDLSPTHLSPDRLSPTPNHSPCHAHIISASEEFMQTGVKEDEDLFLYDMFDISAQGEELQETHTCQVSLFSEHCSLFKEETDQSAHLRTLGLCRTSTSKSPAPKSPVHRSPAHRSVVRSSDKPPESRRRSKEESRKRSRSDKNPRAHLRPVKTRGCDPPKVQASTQCPTLSTPDLRTKTKPRPGGVRSVRGAGGAAAGAAGGGAAAAEGEVSETKNNHNKPFTCSECHRKFSSALTLRRHAGVHSDLRPFSCSLCPYSSRLRASLLQHQRTHTGERPFRCSLCSYASIDRSSLLRHQRGHNNHRPHRCPHCGYSSIQKKSLDLHLQRHHLTSS